MINVLDLTCLRFEFKFYLDDNCILFVNFVHVPAHLLSEMLMLDHVSLRSASLVNYRWYCFCQSDSGLRAKYFDHLRKHFRPRTGKRVAVYRNLRVSTSTTAGRPVSITSQPGKFYVFCFILSFL
ncbi:hypothetical protein C0J52_20078 [Blattella germanica]|nr:hypothetical protein C0J52_20078 [Blattella germanica]